MVLQISYFVLSKSLIDNHSSYLRMNIFLLAINVFAQLLSYITFFWDVRRRMPSHLFYFE